MDRTTYDSARRALYDWLETESGWPDSRDPEFQRHLFKNRCTPQDYEKAMVCHICALEAEEEPYAVAAAIGHVVMNKCGEGSPYVAASFLLEPVTFEPLNEPTLTRLLHNVDSLFARELYDPTLGAQTYVDVRDIRAGQIPTATRVSIGNFIFL